MNDRRPARFPWNYDRSEMVADGVIHVIGICFGLIGAVTLIVVGSRATKMVAIESVFVYAVGLLAMLGSRLPTIYGRSLKRSGFFAASIIRPYTC